MKRLTDILDNPMYNKSQSDDPQCQDYEFTCDICGDGVNSATKFLCGDVVCDDCLHEYIEQQSGDYVEPFVEDYSEDYYDKWWFDNLEKYEQLHIIKVAYKAISGFYSDFNDNRMSQDKIEFCKESDIFDDYVKERLT